MLGRRFGCFGGAEEDERVDPIADFGGEREVREWRDSR